MSILLYNLISWHESPPNDFPEEAIYYYKQWQTYNGPLNVAIYPVEILMSYWKMAYLHICRRELENGACLKHVIAEDIYLFIY